jgi:double-stranded uracil-DNA glycosylase
MARRSVDRRAGEAGNLADLIAHRLDVLFCGINPALSAARSGHHFSNHSNRFWKVLHLSGFTPHVIRSEEDASILQYSCGLTAAVARATIRASDLKAHAFHQAASQVEAKIHCHHPRFVAFLGKPAFAAITHQRSINWGPQPDMWGAHIWVLPNPSGLNRAFSLQQLVQAYSALRIAAAGASN